MRKKIYFQNTFGEKNDKEFTLDGFKLLLEYFLKIMQKEFLQEVN
jgi:hypothetical protein